MKLLPVKETIRGAIMPIEDNADRPLWTVLIPTWNCAHFLEETLRSVLIQDPGPSQMEIIVVDDYSTRDDPEEVVRRLASGRVRFIRQPHNVGKVRNYESGLTASRGKLIHQLHGDDRVKRGYYIAMEHAFTAFPEAGAFFCQCLYIDQTGTTIGKTNLERSDIGILDDWLRRMVVEQRIQTPSIVLRREVYESLGGFDRRLDMFEDWEMWIRTAASYEVGFIPEPLAEYRVSPFSSSARTAMAGLRASVLRKLTQIVDAYLPTKVVEECRRDRNKAMAQYMIQFIPAMMKARRYRAAASAGRDAIGFSHDPQTIYRMINYALTWKRLVTA